MPTKKKRNSNKFIPKGTARERFVKSRSGSKKIKRKGVEVMPAIKINISILEGLYIATSEDLPGLFVADKNIIALFNEIPAVVKALYKESVGKGANQWSKLLM